jgi:hypothetical protein
MFGIRAPIGREQSLFRKELVVVGAKQNHKLCAMLGKIARRYFRSR